MKSNRIVLVSLAVAVMLAVVPAYPGTITFSELGLAPTDNLTNQLATLGVLFSITNGTAVIGSGWSMPVGSNIAGQYVMVNSTAGSASLNVTFVDPSNSSIGGYVSGSSISVDLWDTEASPSPRVIVNAYDLSNVLLGTYNMTAEWVNNAPSGGFTGDVHRLEFVDNGGDGHFLDNLTYGDITAVPEPGTFALLGFGLLGLSMALRRRNRS